jgi:hypothetical protein
MSKYVIVFCISLSALLLTQTAAAQCGGCDCSACCCPQNGGCSGGSGLVSEGVPAIPECDSSCGCCVSPIIVDTTGHGFHLTAAEDGVMFDISGAGKPLKMAWTDRNSGNAFLALDRNHNGKIDSGEAAAVIVQVHSPRSTSDLT